MTYGVGIDEAGYGPTMGPLAVVAIAANTPEATDAHDQVRQWWRAGGRRVVDSKQLHRSGDLGPLEEVALGILTWATGFTPGTAAELFAVLGEKPADWQQTPWTNQAPEVSLPLYREPLVFPCAGGGMGVRGRLLHPQHLNEAYVQGQNRAAAEWQAVAPCLLPWTSPEPADIICDRLGGRLFYADLLHEIRPHSPLTIVEEGRVCCRYRWYDGDEVRFMVRAETHSVLVAAASCVAKYAREVHMHLLNQWWCGQYRWLKPTAGYPQDAKRWLHQIGTGSVAAWGHQLVRGFRGESHH